MKYSDFKAFVTLPDYEKLVSQLKKVSVRNDYLEMLQDYYDGDQWAMNKGYKETRTARSGKEMWKPFGDNPNTGYTKGELKVWNIIRSAIDVYAKYVRGDSKDDVKVTIRKGDTADEDLSYKAQDIFDDLSVWVLESTKKMSIDSVLVTKYTPFDNDNDADLTGSEEDILKKIKMEEQLDLEGVVETIDAREIEPIYWKNMVRGMIRFYYIDKAVAKERYKISGLKKDPMYIECWWINEDGKVELLKLVGTSKIEEESGDAPYEYIPYQIVANQKHTKDNFDYECIETSDVDNLIDLQDDLNAFVTDLGVIYRQVAIPMMKLTDEFVKSAKAGDYKKLEENLKTMRTYAGMILFAPLEKMSGEGVPDSQVRYLQDLLEQYYKETSIPKSVFNSEGLANIAAQTLEYLFQSLATVIGEKRTKLAKIIRDNIKMMMINSGLNPSEYDIEITFPAMFGMTKADKVKFITDGVNTRLLPTKYATEELLKELGDGEKVEEILAQLEEQDAQFKQKVESMAAAASIKANAGNNQDQANQIRENLNNTNRDIKNGNAQPS